MENLKLVLKMVADNGNVKFPVTERQSFLQTSIDNLDLDVRSSNALHRAGCKTVEDVINKANHLHRIRSCGSKSINRIMYGIAATYYNQLTETEKNKYLIQLVELNTN